MKAPHPAMDFCPKPASPGRPRLPKPPHAASGWFRPASALCSRPGAERWPRCCRSFGTASATRALLFLAQRALEEPSAPPVEAVNVVAPNPVRNIDFTRQLGHALHRPAILPAPAFALRLVFGEMADQALLASTRVAPTRLQQKGFEFRHPTLAEALRHELQ
jgi:hypothetical protein